MEGFPVAGSHEIQSLVVEGQTPRFQVRVGNTPGFAAIGVWLDDVQGIAVDNISTRGYSGLSLGALSRERAVQMDSIVPYDAIVLQYGLNVMTPEILHYGSYARKMTEVVRHLRECYPHTDIILMGVGDRSRKANGAFVTMPAVVALSEAQRRAARSAGVVFGIHTRRWEGTTECSIMSLTDRRIKTIRTLTIKAVNDWRPSLSSRWSMK